MSQDASGNAARPAMAGGAGGGGVQGFSPLPTGTRIGELVVQSVLGAGDFGITYIAEHEKRSKRYALKEYFPRAIAVRDGLAVRPRHQAAAAAYGWGLERFLTEARNLQQVRHPAIIAVLGITQHGGTGYVGMAYEQGVDLSIWLHERKKVAPQDELDAMLAPLLEGLAQAHAADVFHFDLTPDSILVRENGTPVLVDFGVFRVGLRRRLPPGNLAAQTYAAPELLATTGGPIGPWTDIYSMAGLVYLAVAGKPPVSAVQRASGTTMQPAAAAAQGRYRPEFLAAIDAGLKMPPAQRPRSVADWSKALLRPAGSRFSLPRLLKSQPADRAAAPLQSRTPQAEAKQPAADEALSLGGTPPPANVPAEGKPSISAPSLLSARAFTSAAFGLAGLLGGALAGSLLSGPIAGLVRSDCTGDSCGGPFVVPFALAGALIGAWEGVRYASRRLLNAKPYEL